MVYEIFRVSGDKMETTDIQAQSLQDINSRLDELFMRDTENLFEDSDGEVFEYAIKSMVYDDDGEIVSAEIIDEIELKFEYQPSDYEQHNTHWGRP